MSKKLKITRRDFLNGIAIGGAVASGLTPLDVLAAETGAGNYPPVRTGMRGSHAGSFEVAHAVAWNGARFPPPKSQTDKVYDLVVAGGGISGLSAAHLFQQRTGDSSSVLVLDNHDDFGGHAKRNEFMVDGKLLIGYGGSQSIDGPARYSAAAKQLLLDVGIHTERFYDYFDRQFSERHKLRRAIHFDSGTYGRNVTAANVFRGWDGGGPDDLESAIADYPIGGASKAALLRLLNDQTDHRPDLDRQEKIDFLRSISYTQYLRKYVDIPREVTDILRDMILGLWGVGWDALSALEAFRSGMPATQQLGIGKLDEPDEHRDEPYIFHFPDGNAGIARSLVRKLIPEAVPGSTMEDLVTSRIDYDLLDRSGSATRIRLESTAVDIRHTADEKHVDVTYVTHGDVYRVRAKHVVFAGYNAMLPYICSEVPEAQKEAIQYAEKVPLVYISIAVRNWRPFQDLGYNNVYIPQSRYIYSFGLDFPVSMGDYRFADSADEPTVIHGTWVPHSPESGLPARKQHVAGRRQLYELTFDDFETDIVAKMSGALEPGGFDAERDIAAITVNRWPHGYAYEYNDLSDPVGFSPKNGPHVAGRAQIGRISIANSDASAYAYANGAIDAADRAVNEQLHVARPTGTPGCSTTVKGKLMKKIAGILVALLGALATGIVIGANAMGDHNVPIPAKISKADMQGAIFDRPETIRTPHGDTVVLDVTTLKSSDGKYATGMYKAGKSRIEVTEPWGVNEFMYFLEGGVTLTSTDGTVQVIGPGEAVTIPEEWTGVWETDGYTKIWAIYSKDGSGL